MTRKDYNLIAEAIELARSEATEPQRDAIYWAANRIANALRRNNPRFERARFMEACGFPHYL